jgi:prephenate dehydrogenase
MGEVEQLYGRAVTMEEDNRVATRIYQQRLSLYARLAFFAPTSVLEAHRLLWDHLHAMKDRATQDDHIVLKSLMLAFVNEARADLGLERTSVGPPVRPRSA